MTHADQEIFDQLDWAFDQMEKAMQCLKDSGHVELASHYGSRWVEVNDDFHVERADGGSGSNALKALSSLESEIMRVMDRITTDIMIDSFRQPK